MKINADPRRNANPGSLVGNPWRNIARSVPHKHADVEQYSPTPDGQAEWLARKLRRAFIGGGTVELSQLVELVEVTIPAHAVSRPEREWYYKNGEPIGLRGDETVVVRRQEVVSGSSAGQLTEFYFVSWAAEWRNVEVPAVTVTVPKCLAQRYATASTEVRGQFTLTADELDAIDAAQAAEEIAMAKKYPTEEKRVPALPRPKKERRLNATRKLVLGGYRRR